MTAAAAPVHAPALLPPARCLRLAAWPALDRAAWERGCTPRRGPFADADAARQLGAAQRRKVLGGYGRWLAYLAEAAALEEVCCPSERVTPERLDAYFLHLGPEGPSLRKRTVRNENTGELLPISGEKG